MLGKTVAGMILVAAASLWSAAAPASELVMFGRAGCVWCQRWDREVGASYDKTEEAKRLPLRRVDVDVTAHGGVSLAGPVRYTPTFVIVEEGREVGRITGYISDDAFWGLLTALTAKLAPVRNPGQIQAFDRTTGNDRT